VHAERNILERLELAERGPPAEAALGLRWAVGNPERLREPAHVDDKRRVEDREPPSSFSGSGLVAIQLKGRPLQLMLYRQARNTSGFFRHGGWWTR
jgi:hypothetical protein